MMTVIELQFVSRWANTRAGMILSGRLIVRREF